MSVDTRGAVLTENKNVFEVCKRIDDALSGSLKSQRQGFSLKETAFKAIHNVHPHLGLVISTFRYRGESRMLHIHFGCDYDLREIGKPGIILSLGMWGSSELIMRTVLASLQDLGPTYIDVNDCDDEGYVLCQHLMENEQ